MIKLIISEVPVQISPSLESRSILSIGYTVVYPIPHITCIALLIIFQQAFVENFLDSDTSLLCK
ncbi:MAG: hypothetical protein WBH31_06640 [Promethearchaeia archaeon]